MKKIVSFCVVLMLIFALCVPCSAYLAGDSDLNGNVNAADARYALRVAAKLENADEQQQKICDVNGDGKVNAADARTILRMAAKLEPLREIDPIVGVKLNTNASSQTLSADEIFNKAAEFTCEIQVFGENQLAISKGTGFFVTADGILVTNYHVIKGAKQIVVRCGGKNYSVSNVLGYDEAKDIAILETSAENVKYAVVSQSYSVGDTVYTLGNPKGYTNTFTQGNISFAERVIPEKNNGVKYIQFTSPVAKGSSGGPLLDSKGNVIGVVALTHDEAQNMNFAVPCALVSKIDISSAQSLDEFSSVSDGFVGAVVMSADGVTVSEGCAAVLYAIASANEDYSLVCKTDNSNVTVYTDGSYGNVHPVYILGVAEGTAEVTVYIEGREQVCATFFVTVS